MAHIMSRWDHGRLSNFVRRGPSRLTVKLVLTRSCTRLLIDSSLRLRTEDISRASSLWFHQLVPPGFVGGPPVANTEAFLVKRVLGTFCRDVPWELG
jgi:hypothetical protein